MAASSGLELADAASEFIIVISTVMTVLPNPQYLLSLAFLHLLHIYLRGLKRRRSLRQLPKPRDGSWLWGNEKQVYEKSVGVTFSEWMEELGRTFRIRGALWVSSNAASHSEFIIEKEQKGDILVLCDPVGVAHILQKRIYDYPHSEIVRPRIARMLGKSLGWVEGEAEHRRMRQLVAPALSTDAIKTGSPHVFEAATSLVNRLDNEVNSNGGTLEVNILDWTSRATLNVIGRFGFGHDFHSGYSEAAHQILGSWRNMATKAMSKGGFYALMVLRRFMFFNYLPLPALRAQGGVRLTIHEGVAQELLRRDHEVGNSGKGNDLLSRLRNQLRKQTVIALRDNKISKEEMLDHISMFIIAGEETTSQTLGFAIWELARHPEKQTRLREEVSAMSELTYNDIQNQMPYLDAVCRETLRLDSPFPYMERISVREDVIPLRHAFVDKRGISRSEVHIYPGQTVIIPIISIHHDAQVWDNAMDFEPERWLGPLPDTTIMPRGWSNTLAFSDGQRNCIGYRLAVFQFKVILATLLRSFRFADTGAKIQNKVASSTQPYVEGEAHLGPNIPVQVIAL